MKVKLLGLAFLAMGFMSCNRTAQEKEVKDNEVAYEIKGTWESSTGDSVFISRNDSVRGEIFIDTLYTDADHQFQTKGEIDYPQRLTLYLVKKGATDNDRNASASVFVDGTPIEIKVKKEEGLFSDFNIKVKGSAQQEILDRLETFMQGQMFIDIAKASPDKNKELDDAVAIFEKDLFHYVDSTRNDVASVYIISDYLGTYYPTDTVVKYYNNLSNEVKASPLGERLGKYIKQMQSLQQGNPAPEIELTTLGGKPFKLSSLRGHYVVLDFWASWCAPCRGEMPNLKAIYNKHKSEGLEMVSISLDEKADKWKAAVEAEGMDWIQVSSLKGFNCPAAKSFSVSSIPSIFIISKDGKIIAHGLRGKELSQEIDKLFQ